MSGGIHVMHVVDALLKTRQALAVSGALQVGVIGLLGSDAVWNYTALLAVDKHTAIDLIGVAVLVTNLVVARRRVRHIWAEMNAHAEPSGRVGE